MALVAAVGASALAAPALARPPAGALARARTAPGALAPTHIGRADQKRPTAQQRVQAPQARQRAQARAQARTHARSIDRLCDRLTDLTQDPAQRRLFALWSTGGRASWVEYHEPRTLEWAMQNHQVQEVAELWMRDDGASAVALTRAGADGEWSAFTDYCFRGDGSLARMESPTATADPGAAVRRRRHFTPGGQSLDESARRGAFAAYLTLGDLPFATLLRSQAQASR
jgi:hypothetical protein